MNGTMRLDCGCGIIQSGDVNVDVKKPKLIHKPFVLADIQHLPFIDNAFDYCLASHVVEHVPDPVAAIDELVRVSKREIEIKVPYWLRWKGKGHLWAFHKRWFKKLLESRGLTTYTCYTGLVETDILNLALEIKVHIYKGKKITEGEW